MEEESKVDVEAGEKKDPPETTPSTTEGGEGSKPAASESQALAEGEGQPPEAAASAVDQNQDGGGPSVAVSATATADESKLVIEMVPPTGQSELSVTKSFSTAAQTQADNRASNVMSEIAKERGTLSAQTVPTNASIGTSTAVGAKSFSNTIPGRPSASAGESSGMPTPAPTEGLDAGACGKELCLASDFNELTDYRNFGILAGEFLRESVEIATVCLCEGHQLADYFLSACLDIICDTGCDPCQCRGPDDNSNVPSSEGDPDAAAAVPGAEADAAPSGAEAASSRASTRKSVVINPSATAQENGGEAANTEVPPSEASMASPEAKESEAPVPVPSEAGGEAAPSESQANQADPDETKSVLVVEPQEPGADA